jgi:hypothetical protein
MYGLPDSAILGTAKRLKRVAGVGRRRTEIEPEDFWALVYAVKRFRARRRIQKQRALFFKKHGYYKQ